MPFAGIRPNQINPPDEPIFYAQCPECDWESQKSNVGMIDKEFCPRCESDGNKVKLNEITACDTCGRFRCVCDDYREEMEFL